MLLPNSVGGRPVFRPEANARKMARDRARAGGRGGQEDSRRRTETAAGEAALHGEERGEGRESGTCRKRVEYRSPEKVAVVVKEHVAPTDRRRQRKEALKQLGHRGRSDDSEYSTIELHTH